MVGIIFTLKIKRTQYKIQFVLFVQDVEEKNIVNIKCNVNKLEILKYSTIPSKNKL